MIWSTKSRFWAFFLLFASLVLGACSGGGEKYGAGVDTSLPVVQVKDIFFQQDIVGQRVTLEGRIVGQCASNGCWFNLQDDTGHIFVDLSRNGFELPSLPNRPVKASGTVARSKQAFMLIASGVEVQ
ncbi:MAG: DNA-binding protein [Desulfamplus sp.]|nr:DNA-binding protein [Desulfamplus sp.]